MSEELKIAEAAQKAGFHPATCVLLLNGKDALLSAKDVARIADALSRPAPATVATEAVAQGVWSQEQVDAINTEAAALLSEFQSKPVAQGGGVDVEKVMGMVRDYGIHCERYGHDGLMYEEIRALLSTATPVSEGGVDHHAVAQFLYGLLDDIDTAGDAAKADDKLYRSFVESIQARKREVVAECDGYTVQFKTPAIANQEPR